jgi:hypothetical protein
MMVFTTDPTHIEVGQVWLDKDLRNADRGKSGRARPKFRHVEIVSVPTLSMPGSFRVIKAPNNPGSVGKVRKFTRAKLIANYVRID